MAGYIKRKLVVSLAALAAYAALVSLIALLFDPNWIIILATGLFLVGAIVGGWFFIRGLAAPLAALGQLERAIQDSSERELAQPLPTPLSDSEDYGGLFRGYNALVERLKERDTLRLEFIGQLVHELRSPLASVLGYASLLTESNPRPGTTEIENYARIINAQAQRMIRLTDDVLTAALAQSNRLATVPTPMRLDSLLVELIAELADQYHRPIDFSPPSEPVTITADVLRMRQVLINLIENAIKFSPAQSPVLVELRPLEAEGGVEIAVTDHGAGIAEADLSKLFRPFGRIKSARTRGIAGSGLGLYIVQHIIRLHGGSIRVASQPGEGSVFTIALPLSPSEAES